LFAEKNTQKMMITRESDTKAAFGCAEQRFGDKSLRAWRSQQRKKREKSSIYASLTIPSFMLCRRASRAARLMLEHIHETWDSSSMMSREQRILPAHRDESRKEKEEIKFHKQARRERAKYKFSSEMSRFLGPQQCLSSTG
jgi:hypothetical protein